MKRWQKITLASVLTLLLLMLLLPLTLPPLVRHYGGGWLQENTGRTLSLGDLSLNLFTWTLELRQVALSEPNSAEPFASFERLTLKMSPMSLFQRAIIVREFQLVAPRIRIVRQDERFNFSDFTELQQPEENAPAEPAAADKPLRFSLNNLQITDGALLYLEQQKGIETQRHRIVDLDLAVPFIGNTPYLVDKYVTPALHVLINDAPLDLGGKLKLFSDAVEVAVDIDLKKVDLPFYFNLLPKTLPLDIPSGTLGSDLELVYRVAKTQPPDLQISGDVQLSVLRLNLEQDGHLLFLP
ncbi:MAG: AsmA family protein, partial [Desulfuromonadaceae bacterium]